MKRFLFALAVCVFCASAIHVGDPGPPKHAPSESSTASPAKQGPSENSTASPAKQGPSESSTASPAKQEPSESNTASPAKQEPSESSTASPAKEEPSESSTASPAKQEPSESSTASPAKEEPSESSAASPAKQYPSESGTARPSQIAGVLDNGVIIVMGVGAGIVVVGTLIWGFGLEAACQILLYITTVASVKFCMKIVYRYGFAYPCTTTAFHLFLSAFAASVVMCWRRLMGTPIPVPDFNQLWFGILPISLTFGLSIGAENSALVFVSTAFSEVVAAMGPVVAACLTWAFGMQFRTPLLLPIGVALIGCVVAVTGEMYFSALGMCLLFLAVVLRGTKVVMQQKLMAGKGSMDPVSLMAWTCGIGFVELAVGAVMIEGVAPFQAIQNAPDARGLCLAILLSGVVACVLNLTALVVVKQLGAVGMQLVSQLKSVLVVIIGVLFLNESFTRMQQVGFFILLVGIFFYSRLKRSLDAEGQEEEKSRREQEHLDADATAWSCLGIACKCRAP